MHFLHILVWNIFSDLYVTCGHLRDVLCGDSYYLFVKDDGCYCHVTLYILSLVLLKAGTKSLKEGSQCM